MDLFPQVGKPGTCAIEFYSTEGHTERGASRSSTVVADDARGRRMRRKNWTRAFAQ